MIKLKGEIRYSIIIAGDFNIPTPKPQTVFSVMDRTWQKINNEIENPQGNRLYNIVQNNIVRKLDLTDIYRIIFLQHHQNIHSCQAHVDHSS